MEPGQSTLLEDMGRARDVVFVVDLLGCGFVQLVREDVVKLFWGERNHAFVVERIGSSGKMDLMVERVRTLTPAGPAKETAVPAEPRPRLSSSWMKRPPNE